MFACMTHISRLYYEYITKLFYSVLITLFYVNYTKQEKKFYTLITRHVENSLQM